MKNKFLKIYFIVFAHPADSQHWLQAFTWICCHLMYGMALRLWLCLLLLLTMTYICFLVVELIIMFSKLPSHSIYFGIFKIHAPEIFNFSDTARQQHIDLWENKVLFCLQNCSLVLLVETDLWWSGFYLELRIYFKSEILAFENALKNQLQGWLVATFNIEC